MGACTAQCVYRDTTAGAVQRQMSHARHEGIPLGFLKSEHPAGAHPARHMRKSRHGVWQEQPNKAPHDRVEPERRHEIRQFRGNALDLTQVVSRKALAGALKRLLIAIDGRHRAAGAHSFGYQLTDMPHARADIKHSLPSADPRERQQSIRQRCQRLCLPRQALVLGVTRPQHIVVQSRDCHRAHPRLSARETKPVKPYTKGLYFGRRVLTFRTAGRERRRVAPAAASARKRFSSTCRKAAAGRDRGRCRWRQTTKRLACSRVSGIGTTHSRPAATSSFTACFGSTVTDKPLRAAAAARLTKETFMRGSATRPDSASRRSTRRRVACELSSSVSGKSSNCFGSTVLARASG